MRILVVDDDVTLTRHVTAALTEAGHDPIAKHDGETALGEALGTPAFDLIVLDVGLPRMNGFDVLRKLRGRKVTSRVLMLTARGEVGDRVTGLQLGADDYLPKPFELAILIARINGLLRRRGWNETPLDAAQGKPPAEPRPRDVYTFADRTLDFTAMEVQARGQSYRLTQMECDLLRYLVTHAGQPVSRGALLENVWGLHEETDTRAIDNFIVRLRKYLEDKPDSHRFLQTVRGVGYKFVPDGR
jgi:two-component system, OmpR family, alkaline phosphatase synthesis response regulator PhoP